MKKLLAFLLAVVTVFTCCACGSSEKEETTVDYTVEKTEPLISPNEAYLDILKAHAEAITDLTVPAQYGGYYLKDKNGSSFDLTVSFCDITHDGIDEMFFVEGEKASGEPTPHAAIPHVYTFENGKAVEMTIDNNGIKCVDNYKKSGGLLFGSVAAAGIANTYYLVFLGTDGNVYVLDRAQDMMNNYYLHVYQANGNRLILNKEVANLYGPNSDYSGTRDDYYINGQLADYYQGIDEFKRLDALYQNTIIYNGNFEDIPLLMQKVNYETNLSMSYDDAVAYLNMQ